MEEKEKIEGENSLNQEESQEAGDNQEEGQGEKSYSAEEVAELLETEKKKLSSASEKGVQKILKSNKLLEEGYQALVKIADDNSYLIGLADEKPEVAKLVLDKFYGGMSLDNYKEQIGYEEDLTDPKVLERKVERLTQKKLEEKTIEKSLSTFIDKLQLDNDDKEAFIEAFNERKQLKSFKLDDIEKHLEKAFKEIADDETIKKLKTTEIIGKTISTGEGKSGKTDKKPEGGLDTEIKSFLTKYL